MMYIKSAETVTRLVQSVIWGTKDIVDCGEMGERRNESLSLYRSKIHNPRPHMRPRH